MSPSLRWWPSWWWPLVHLRSFRCRLLDGSHYTRLTNVRQIESTQTTPKPLQTLAFIGVSQPHDGDIKTADATATATTSRTPQPQHDTATAGAASRATRPRHRHDVRDATGTAMIAYKGTCPRGTTRHAKTQSYKRSNAAPCNKYPPWGSLPPGPSAGAGGTIAEIVRGFLKSSRTKRDACNLSSRSTYGLQAFQNQVAQPLLHLFC